MLLPAAVSLQAREAGDRAAGRDRRLTVYGLFVAAAALVADVWLKLAKELHWWPY